MCSWLCFGDGDYSLSRLGTCNRVSLGVFLYCLYCSLLGAITQAQSLGSIKSDYERLVLFLRDYVLALVPIMNFRREAQDVMEKWDGLQD